MNRFTALAILLIAALGARLGFDAANPRGTPMELRRSLDKVPREVFGPGWQMREVTLSEDVIRRTGTDSHINRSYRKGSAIYTLYVGYVAGFRENSVHHPLVCMPSLGLELERQDEVRVEIPGRPEGLRFNEYVWKPKDPSLPRLHTLTTFCYNGVFEPSEVYLRVNGWRANYFSIISLHQRVTRSLHDSREDALDKLRRTIPELLLCFPDPDAPEKDASSAADPNSTRSTGGSALDG